MAVIPEQGQLVRVRHHHWLVQDVLPGNIEPSEPPLHRIRLEGLDDDILGEPLDVIWEHELHTEVHDAIGLPRPDAWDPLPRFDAFINATRWTLSSVLERFPLQAPFRGNIRIEDFQLEPVVRALRMPRVSLLIADDVGLGKTIEAGLVMQELIARQRVRRVLIVCPASLQKQWAEEMQHRFALRFETVDRDYMRQLRREYGIHVNPWASYPRLITSMDFLKREAPMAAFKAALATGKDGTLRDWDLLILDEAHNVAPSGRGTWARDSDRTIMMREVKESCEHRLFLTATPHNGYTESFTALLEMLDPIRFSRGPHLDRDQLDAVMVRRLKEGILDLLGEPVFPKRDIVPLLVAQDELGAEMLSTLDRYMRLRLGRADKRDTLPVRFGLIMLKRRLLSCPQAFCHSIGVHKSHLVTDEQVDEDAARVVAGLRAKLAEEHDNDEEKDQAEQAALIETARFFQVTDEEMQLVESLHDLAERAQKMPDGKARVLLDLIREKLRKGHGWSTERLLIFTEFKHTLDYIEEILGKQGWGDRLLTLYGGMPSAHREAVKAAFRVEPDDGEGAVRILLATDAAAEGLNLQDHCRYLVHYDIPWNPNRMEQRNGRIDRHGQPAKRVFCHHFIFEGREDLEFLATLVNKVHTMRHDMGAVGDVIAAQVEQAMLGQRRTLDLPNDHLKKVRDEVRAQVLHRDQVRKLQHAWKDARRVLGLNRRNLHGVVVEALRLEGHGRLEPVDDPELAGKAWWPRDLPASWSEAREAIKDPHGRLLKVVFDEADARGRKDAVLVHLDHPLMKRALAVFRANLWSQGLHDRQRLNRVSYRVLADEHLDRPVLVAWGRLVVVGQAGSKLDEELFPVGGDMVDRELVWLEPGPLDRLLALDSKHPAIPASLGGTLRTRFAHHERALLQRLEEEGQRRGEDARTKLRKKGTEDAGTVRKLIDQRIKEIERSLRTLREQADDRQTTLWPQEQLEQHRNTIGYLERRRDQLRVERRTQPERVKARYRVKPPRAFPMALLYLLPESLVSGGSR